ncbi:MAG: folate-binding protein [Mariprofundaceae bacterium]|nr:folate-binding protein [Mariprofundaceae bacterium]
MITYLPRLACHRTSYRVLKASGRDIRAYLQSQITQDISLLTPEHPIYTAVLTPQGKMVADMYLIDAGEELFIITIADTAIALVERLRQFSMGHLIRLGLVESLSVLSIQGKVCATASTAIQSFIQASMPMSEAASEGCWLIVENSFMSNVLAFLSHEKDMTICSDLDMEQACIMHGTPRFGRDWDASIHPMNANIIEMNGVSFDKGCYVGQEVTSRMHWRGGVKKKLYHIQLSAMPKHIPCSIQTTVTIGRVTSAASNQDGMVRGIAHLPIETVEKQASLTLDHDVTVTVLSVCHA